MNDNRNDITSKKTERTGFTRRHTVVSDSVTVGKKQFRVTCFFPIGGETDAKIAEEQIRILLGDQKKCG